MNAAEYESIVDRLARFGAVIITRETNPYDLLAWQFDAGVRAGVLVKVEEGEEHDDCPRCECGDACYVVDPHVTDYMKGAKR